MRKLFIIVLSLFTLSCCSKDDISTTGKLNVEINNLPNDLKLRIYFDCQTKDFFQEIKSIEKSKINLDLNIGNYAILPISSTETYEKIGFQIVQNKTTFIIYDQYNMGKIIN